MGYNTDVTLVVEAPHDDMLTWISTIALTEKLTFVKNFLIDASVIVPTTEHSDRLRMFVEYNGKFYDDFDWVQRIYEVIDEFVSGDMANRGARFITIGEGYDDIKIVQYGDWCIDMYPYTCVSFDFEKPHPKDDVRKAQDSS